MPSVDVTLKYDLPPGSGSSAESETGPNSYLENLQFLLMVSGEARRNEWALSSDLIYLDFGKDESTLKSVGGGEGAISVPRQRNVDTQTDLSGWAWSFASWLNACSKIARASSATKSSAAER